MNIALVASTTKEAGDACSRLLKHCWLDNIILQNALLYTTGNCLWSCMYEVMYLQMMTLPPEWYFTHITESGHSPLCMSEVPVHSAQSMAYSMHLLHILQENGSSSLCMCWCVFISLCRLNDLLHTLQENGSSSLCMSYLEMTLLPEWFITHTTQKWPLPTMYALMTLPNTLLPEWLITHIIRKWQLATMY
jgi:hypothetical protein